jgi:hypothetical protein
LGLRGHNASLRKFISGELRFRCPFHFNPPSREIESLPAIIPSGSFPPGRPGLER